MKMFTVAALACLGLAAGVSATAAQDVATYPDRPVDLIIPFDLGSGDAQARAFAAIAEEFLGQRIIPSNHPGGNSAIGLNYALNRPADGYTMIFLSGSFPLSVANEQIPFGVHDVKPVVAFNADYLTLAVRADSPFQTFEDFVEHARENPGAINVGGTVLTGTHHVLVELVADGADVEVNYVPYDGANGSLIALLSNTIDVLSSSPSTVRQYVETGEVRLLGVSTSERVEAYPDVPTFLEMGIENVSDFINYRGYYVHPDTPAPLVEKLSDAFGEAFQSPAWAEYLEAEQQIPFYRNHADLYEHVDNYYESIVQVLREIAD